MRVSFARFQVFKKYWFLVNTEQSECLGFYSFGDFFSCFVSCLWGVVQQKKEIKALGVWVFLR